MWLFDSLAGIRVLPDAIAFSRAVIQPRPPPASAGLTWVNASVTTVRGIVSAAWNLFSNGTFSLTATTPPNMDVAILMPDGSVYSPGSGTHAYTCMVPPV